MADAGREFQRLVADLDYPMYVVTAAAGGERAGCLVGFATQCSLDPPRYMVCISKNNRTYRVAREASLLAVHVPGEEDLELARLFGERTGDDVDKFELCRWEAGPDGVTPLLSGCARWFLGRVLDQVDAGDHVGFLLEPVDASGGDGPATQLGFQAVKDLRPGHEA